MAASLTDTVYVPAANVGYERSEVQVEPPSMVYWYVPYPPLTPLIVNEPVEVPKHITFVVLTVAAKAAGWVIAKLEFKVTEQVLLT